MNKIVIYLACKEIYNPWEEWDPNLGRAMIFLFLWKTSKPTADQKWQYIDFLKI